MELGVKVIIGYVDDFLIITNSIAKAYAAQDVLLGVLTALGFEIAPKKCKGPTQKIVFLGLTIDAIKKKV